LLPERLLQEKWQADLPSLSLLGKMGHWLASQLLHVAVPAVAMQAHSLQKQLLSKSSTCAAAGINAISVMHVHLTPSY
jgi:hypothetical protein